MRFYNFLISKEFMIELIALIENKYRLNQRVLLKFQLSICLLNVLGYVLAHAYNSASIFDYDSHLD
jgi:hypothetical protein